MLLLTFDLKFELVVFESNCLKTLNFLRNSNGILFGSKNKNGINVGIFGKNPHIFNTTIIMSPRKLPFLIPQLKYITCITHIVLLKQTL